MVARVFRGDDGGELLERMYRRSFLSVELTFDYVGDRIAEAERIGIVNRVVPAAEFDAAVKEWAERLTAKSPVIMKLGKDAVFRQQDMAFADALEYLRSQLTLALSTEDIEEGVRAFFEKREPVWKGQ